MICRGHSPKRIAQIVWWSVLVLRFVQSQHSYIIIRVVCCWLFLYRVDRSCCNNFLGWWIKRYDTIVVGGMIVVVVVVVVVVVTTSSSNSRTDSASISIS